VGGAAILAVLLWRLGTAAFLDGVRVIDSTTLVLAAAIGVLTTVLSAWRWCLVARGLGLHLPLRDAVGAYYRALFLNAALPGGVLGDAHRAVRHGRDVGDVGAGVTAVVLERTAGQVVLVVVGGVVLFTVPSPVTDGLWTAASGSATGVAVCAGVAIALAAALCVLARRRTSRWARALRAVVADTRRGLFRRHGGPAILAVSVLVLVGHLSMFVVAARAAGSVAPVVRLVPLMLLALLAMTLPVNIGGWGPREGVMTWAFAAAGMSAAQGLTVAVVYGLLAFVASLPGAGILAARWIGRLRTVRTARTTDAARAVGLARAVHAVHVPEPVAALGSESA
jgi:uncharacterized membrane protein YbhN (UPF0104 family)